MNSSNKSKNSERTTASLDCSFNGVLLIDKPAGITSFDVLRRLKTFGLRDVGHGGTLDPFATGLLVVFSGTALRLAEYFLKSDKAYEATVVFGATTASGDVTDPVLETSATLPATLATIQKAAHEFEGQDYLQTPPMHSAKKIDGKKLYELARQGKTVEREPVKCRVWNFKILDFTSPRARFSVEVGSGTFIRVLAQDLAKKLGSLGYLDQLRRLRSGPFKIEQASKLEEIATALREKKQPPGFMSFDQVIQALFTTLEIDHHAALAAWNGHQPKLFKMIEGKLAEHDQHARLALTHQGEAVAVLIRDENKNWVISKAFPRLASQDTST